MEMKDFLSHVRGVFTLIGRDSRGNIVLDYQDNNLIVSTAKQVLATLCSDSTATGLTVTQIGIGESDSTPALEDTSLTNSYIKTIAGFTYPESGQVKFDWYIDYTEANGLAMREFGLLTEDGTLFARKVRGLITKDNDLSLEGSWTIVF